MTAALGVVLYVVAFLLAFVVVAEDFKYDWERLNYYQILGLAESSYDEGAAFRMDYNQTEIKRAYRRQAQQHHPDKQKQKNGDDGSSVSRVEEVNARFAKIAEAYEVLSDKEKKMEYDLVLQSQSQQRRRRRRSGNEMHTGRDSDWRAYDSYSDPYSLFNQMFGSTFDDFQHQRGYEDYFSHNAYRHHYQNRNDRRRRQNSRPVDVSEWQEVLYDPDSDREILRVFRKELFADGYYWIVSQDFVQDYYDNIIPASEPLLYDEGYVREHNYQHHHESRQGQSKQKRKSNRGRTQDGDILREGDMMYPMSNNYDDNILWSSSGEYYAALSPSCELFVAYQSSTNLDDGDSIVWSTETFVPGAVGQCFVTIYNGEVLLLAGSDLNHSHGFIWNSGDSSSSSFVRQNFFNDNSKKKNNKNGDNYYLMLENDGVLAVYLHNDDVREEYHQNIFEGFREKFRYPSTTKAALAWKMTKKWIKQVVKRSYQNREGDVCIWTSSFGGCNNGVRKLISTSKGIHRNTQHIYERLVRFVQDGGEDDFDVFDTILRVANKAGNQVSFTVYQLARKSLIEGRIASKLLKDMMQTKMRKMRRSSNARQKRQRTSSR